MSCEFENRLSQTGSFLRCSNNVAGHVDDTVEVTGRGELTAIDRDMSDTPDQVPTIAALAPFARGTTTIRGVPHLRIKESDRIAALATELVYGVLRHRRRLELDSRRLC